MILTFLLLDFLLYSLEAGKRKKLNDRVHLPL